MRLEVRGTPLGQCLAREQRSVSVVAQATRVVVHHIPQGWALLADFKHLVDLLLILHDDHANVRILQHVNHLLRHGILIQGNGDGAKSLGSHHRQVELWAIFPDHRDVLATLDAQRRQTMGQDTDPVMDLLPGQCLPDTEVLFADSRTLTTHACMLCDQGREGIRRGHGGMR